MDVDIIMSADDPFRLDTAHQRYALSCVYILEHNPAVMAMVSHVAQVSV
jgi:hypothetical protein